MPKVAILVPSGDTWKAEMAISLVALMRECSDMEMHLLWFMGSQITHSRNELVKMALKAEVDYALWWDSDIVMPASALYELLGHKKDIVGATYLRKKPPYKMLGKLKQAVGRLKPADLMPGGCMLVKMDVYRSLGWPWYFEEIVQGKLTWEEGIIQSEDYGFCKKALGKGYDIWCDINLSQRLLHIGGQEVRMTLPQGHADRVEINDV